MKKLFIGMLAVMISISAIAYAGGDELKYYRVDELLRFTGPPTATDESLVADGSQGNKVVRIKTRLLGVNGAFGTDVYANCNQKWKRQFVTLAQINAGAILLASSSGDTIHLGDPIMFVSGGDFAIADEFVIEDTLGNNIIEFTSAVGLADTLLRPGDTGVTVSRIFHEGLTAGRGVKVVKTGGAATTAAGVDIKLPYCIQ